MDAGPADAAFDGPAAVIDGRAPTADGGASGSDGGTPGADGATPLPDAGVLRIDAAVSLPDAGVFVDAGTARDAAVLCPAGYAAILGSTSSYRVAPAGDNWLPAEQACELEGTHLMIVDDASEGMLVNTVLPSTTIWVGVSDRVVVGEYRAVTGGIASYLPWAAGEPTAASVNCVGFDGLAAVMSDIVCGAGRRYICECDGRPVVPGSY